MLFSSSPTPDATGPDGKHITSTGGCMERQCNLGSYTSGTITASPTTTTITVPPTTISVPAAMCPHARADWRMCPHCLGINTAEPQDISSYITTSDDMHGAPTNFVCQKCLEKP